VVAEQPLDEMPPEERAALLSQIDRGLESIRLGVSRRRRQRS